MFVYLYVKIHSIAGVCISTFK